MEALRAGPHVLARLALELAAISSFLLPPAAALAISITFSTSDSRFDPGGSGPAIDNQGWWSDSLANIDSNDNYFVGIGQSPGDHRNFFSFDLSALPAVDVVSATLRLRRHSSAPGNEGVETLELFDVSTDAATLNQNVGVDLAIFADLGSGTSYGAFDVPGSGSDTDVFEFALNGAALADIEAAAGGFFSIGGVLASDDGNDALFASSADDSTATHQLLVVIPEPATGAMLLVGLLGLAGPRRPRT